MRLLGFHTLRSRTLNYARRYLASIKLAPPHSVAIPRTRTLMSQRKLLLDNAPNQDFCLQHRAISQVQTDACSPGLLIIEV